jgi:uncharacterized surface protein with fasciclin (FAS1) repeats
LHPRGQSYATRLVSFKTVVHKSSTNPRVGRTLPVMKRARLVPILVLALAMASCESNPSTPEATSKPDPLKKVSPAGQESMQRRTENAQRLQEMNKVTVENKLSPYRYVISTERFSIFGQLVKASSHSRTIHGSGVTLLCPTNDAFESFDAWKMMLRQGNQEELDAFVAHHVLPVIMTYEDFKLKDTHTTLAGDEMEVSTQGGIYANGAHVRSGFVPTENGSVLGLDDVAFVPFSLR